MSKTKTTKKAIAPCGACRRSDIYSILYVVLGEADIISVATFAKLCCQRIVAGTPQPTPNHMILHVGVGPDHDFHYTFADGLVRPAVRAKIGYVVVFDCVTNQFFVHSKGEFEQRYNVTWGGLHTIRPRRPGKPGLAP